MLCQECRRNEANVHIVKNVNGRQTELNFCEDCARKKEELDLSFESQFSLHKLFSSMLAQAPAGNRKTGPGSDIVCSNCSLTFAQFSQIGRFGCSECVSAFEEKLEPVLRRIHTGSSHTGKVPVKARNRVNKLRELDKMSAELNSLIQSENFEEAAILRDRIRAMEREINADENNKGELS